MSKISFKEIINYIKKNALAPPSAPASVPASAPAPSAPVSFKDQEVIKMQSALIALGNKISSAFSDGYVKSIIPDLNIYAIANSMKNIGGTRFAQSSTPDGNWGPNTHAALQNARSFAEAMLKLAKNYGIRISYTDDNLKNFYLEQKYTDYKSQDKTNEAVALITHINVISKMVDEIKSFLDKNQGFLEGKKTYVKYEKQVVFTPDESKQINSLETPNPANDIIFKVPQPGTNNLLAATINYSDLVSSEKFNNWFNSDRANELREFNVNKGDVISSIRKLIQSKLNLTLKSS